ncbi:MAG: OmpA family protein, partial [Bacteroidales bacterium]
DKTATVDAEANTLVFAQKVASALHAIDGFEAHLVSETGGSGTAPQAPGALAIALFDTGSASLKATALRELEHLATVFAGEKGRPLTVFGYADTRGNTEYNRNLGKRRAEAVAAQLQTLGFSNVEVADAINHGEDRWTGTPDSIANAQLRRAEVRDRSNESAH